MYLQFYSFHRSQAASPMEMVPGLPLLSHHWQLVLKNVKFCQALKSPWLSLAQPCAVAYGMLQKPFFPSKFSEREREILSKLNIRLWEGLF